MSDALRQDPTVYENDSDSRMMERPAAAAAAYHHLFHRSHSSSSSNPFPDDELVTWLQCPFDDDTLGKAYWHWPPAGNSLPAATTSCSYHDPPDSAYFGSSHLKHLPPSEDLVCADSAPQRSGAACPSPGAGILNSGGEAIRRQPFLLGTEQQQAWTTTAEATGASLPKEKKELDRKDTMTNIDLHRKHGAEPILSGATLAAAAKSSTDAALALGASRAAGMISQTGIEAFSKVRTSLQPGVPRAGSPSASMLPPRMRTFGSYGGMLTHQPTNKSTGIEPPVVSRTGPLVYLVENQDSRSPMGNSLESSTTGVVGSQNLPNADQGASALLGTVETHVAGGSCSEAVTKLKSPAEKRPAECIDIPSGGSTSESLKEAVSSGKRKLNGSQCQSEDAEGESAVNSLARTSSTSKRSRAADTHNASERRRRERINEKLQALAELIPNSTKTHKASLLDEAIEYIKTLQLQLQVMSLRSGVSLSPMVLPSGLSHMQISHPNTLHSMRMGAGGASGTTAAIIPNPGFDAAHGVARQPLNSLSGHPATLNYGLRPVPGSLGYAFQPIGPLGMTMNNLQSSSSTESLPVYFPHPQLRIPSQAIPSVNMELYNSFMQQQQQLHQQQRQQQQ